ncbi:hypothetical protein HDF26_001223 [Pedobacter cryoconitis]|uniref:hypothetical protein n=1 Tax=Pedobacter cryoconitis TaxID=188932 RepID=UPI00161F68B0|nr:hypothetical protein [Pedobacter cryoconitis]MBB6270796.1 hypothetical protein [Pedobacter cryoconitis]
MRIIFICLLSFMFCNITKAEAQSKRVEQDTIFYFLDTVAIPANHRVIDIERESQYVGYILRCKCYPLNADPVFYTRVDSYKKIISKEEFNKIKTVSLKKLIEIAVKYAKEKVYSYKFFFIEPAGKDMKVIKVNLEGPRKPDAILYNKGEIMH